MGHLGYFELSANISVLTNVVDQLTARYSTSMAKNQIPLTKVDINKSEQMYDWECLSDSVVLKPVGLKRVQPAVQPCLNILDQYENWFT